ncbi:MAG: hypothetical protein UV40_C0038G0010 [Parcubacteria group bacterium GW2011_GWA1_42_7]|nr:MAG: hypothetical protein UV34_C0016G0013 [Parcubacteria group bacterium GW2011_GWB1_42_6]KKS68968.1 MAG: hypothetical protein UV40_C0038G0010 [Parcubacteria group bacterium GW2011_GWA1_42_7]KKS91303.1 MAG: hypothetical protein UV67_C0032G0009 [Parcubacteria group bacterium GW2011_GWC1_43_12]
MKSEILPREAFEISQKTQRKIQQKIQQQERLRKKHAKIPIGGKFPIGIRERIFNFLCFLFRVRTR